MGLLDTISGWFSRSKDDDEPKGEAPGAHQPRSRAPHQAGDAARRDVSGAIDFEAEFDALMALATPLITAPRAADVDKNWGAPSGRKINEILTLHMADLTNFSHSWDDSRRAVAVVQLAAKKVGLYDGDVEGLWGPYTSVAYARCLTRRDKGVVQPGPIVDPASGIDFSAEYRGLFALALSKTAFDGKNEIDQNWGSASSRDLNAILDAHRSELHDYEASWDDSRKAMALLQLVAKKIGADPGPIDGHWGVNTEGAYEESVYFRDNGVFPGVKDPATLEIWPAETRDGFHLRRVFGDPSASDFVSKKMRRIDCLSDDERRAYEADSDEAQRKKIRETRLPYRFRIYSPDGGFRTSLQCHKLVRDSLRRVLWAVYDHYGYDEIVRLRLHVFSGDYNRRRMTGLETAWSAHAYGIAYDWDHSRNSLKWTKPRASLSGDEYAAWWECWEREGWWSLGRDQDFDYMHVQAAKPFVRSRRTRLPRKIYEKGPTA